MMLLADLAHNRLQKDAKCFADSGMRSTNGYLQRSQGVRRIAGALVGNSVGGYKCIFVAPIYQNALPASSVYSGLSIRRQRYHRSFL